MERRPYLKDETVGTFYLNEDLGRFCEGGRGENISHVSSNHSANHNLHIIPLNCFHDTHPTFMFVLIGRVRRSGIALHPPPPLPPLHPLILHLSEVKSTWERGWSTRRRDTVTHVILRGTTVGPQTEALESTRATTQREAEDVDL